MARGIQCDKRFNDAGRAAKIDELDNRLCDLCGDRFMDEAEPLTGLESNYRNLVGSCYRAPDFILARSASSPAFV